MPQQRDIVMVGYALPQGMEYHPAIIISNDGVYAVEDIFYAVMCSSEIRPEEFALELTADMIVGKHAMPKRTFVKTHLIQSYTRRDIGRHIGSVTIEAFDRIRARITDSIFDAR